jgi:hypothetical protein
VYDLYTLLSKNRIVFVGPHVLFTMADQDDHIDGRSGFRRSCVFYITSGPSMFFDATPIPVISHLAYSNQFTNEAYTYTVKTLMNATRLDRSKIHIQPGNTCIVFGHNIRHAGASSFPDEFESCVATGINGRLAMYLSVHHITALTPHIYII